MIPEDALLFVRCRMYIYRSLSGSSVLALLRMVHVPLGSRPFQALDRSPLLFCCEDLDIFYVSIGPFLFRAICCSTCHFSSNFLSCNISSYLLGSISCSISIAFIAICKYSGGISVTICRLPTGVVEYALYIFPGTLDN